jgi:hypothetical protein
MRLWAPSDAILRYFTRNSSSPISYCVEQTIKKEAEIEIIKKVSVSKRRINLIQKVSHFLQFDFGLLQMRSIGMIFRGIPEGILNKEIIPRNSLNRSDEQAAEEKLEGEKKNQIRE